MSAMSCIVYSRRLCL